MPGTYDVFLEFRCLSKQYRSEMFQVWIESDFDQDRDIAAILLFGA